MNSVVHLTEEQIDDYLIGDLSADLTAHLAGCMECQARVAELEGAIGSFNDVSLAWSERQSATLPVRPIAIKPTTSVGSRSVWAATAVATIAVAVAIPLAYHGLSRTPDHGTLHASPIAVTTYSEEREQQIAQDNQMLQAIDREIGAPVSSPAETFGLELGSLRQHSLRSSTQRD